MSKSWVITGVLLCITVVVSGQTTVQPPNLWLPFGEAEGDDPLLRQNDVSLEVLLNVPVTFYGKKYSSIFINDNGVLSFNKGFYQFQYEILPITEKEILIAPFLADVSLEKVGRIWYRQTSDQAQLRTINEKIGQYFVRNSNFKAKGALVVTWDKVGFFESKDSSVTNTFQCVVATDTVSTFVFFVYGHIAWTTGAGPASGGGDENTGLGGNPPQVGFDAGDGKTKETLDVDDFDDGALDLPAMSNLDPADPPGLFVYRVSDDSVYFPECKKSDNPEVYPTHASMRGGSRLTVGGLCFEVTDDILMRFVHPDADEPISHTVKCRYISNYQAACVMPLMDRIGQVTVEISKDDGASWKGGDFTIMPIDSEKPGVNRTNPYDLKWFTAEEDLSITWDRDAIEDALVDITILSYSEQNVTAEGDAYEWKEIALAANVSNSGRYTIKVGARPDVTHDNALGMVRVAAASSPHNVVLSSDVHFLGYVLGDAGYQEDPRAWSNAYCERWYEEDQKEPPFVDELNVCPCTYQQALADRARFVATPYCDATKQTPEALQRLDYCFARPQIKHCVLGVVRNPSQADSECCYDAEDNLVYAQDSVFGSFSNRISRFSGNVPGLSGAATDLVPYVFCNVIGQDEGNLYRQARPTRDCADYEPVRPASMFGDPHFVTLDNRSYTFNGLGEYVLMRTKEKGESGFQMQGRFEKVVDRYGNSQSATVLTALAMQEGEDTETRIQVERNDITAMRLKVGPLLRDQDIGQSVYQQYSGFRVIFPGNSGDGIVPKMIFLFRRTQIGLVVESNGHSLTVSALLPSAYKGQNVMEGLFGNWDDVQNDDLQSPDGGVIPLRASQSAIFSFGQSWEIEVSLFSYDLGDSHESHQDNDFSPVFSPSGGVSDRDLDKVCGDSEPCRFDFLVTRDSGLATQTKLDDDAAKVAFAASEKLLMCPFMTTPAYGTKIFVGDRHHAPGSRLRYACSDGYIFLGESQRDCSEQGQWSDDSEPSCQKIQCESLIPPDHGSMEVSVKGDVITATFTCDEGASLEGSPTRTCGSDRKWTGEETRCKKEEKQVGGSNTAVIVVVVIVVLVVVAVSVGLIVYFYKKKQESGSRKATRPPDSAYQPVETTATGETGDVELGTKPDKQSDDGENDSAPKSPEDPKA